MIEPVMVALTKEILDTLPIEKIIYAEFAPLGAMGNEGGVMLYIIKDDKLICYEANIYKDKNLYNDAVSVLEKNSISSRFNMIKSKNGTFKFYGGGMGNNVFINKDASLKIGNGYFIYVQNNEEYIIFSSVEGVFIRVAHAIKMRCRPKTSKRLKDYLNNYLDEAEEQNEPLYEKLDQEIIEGKEYTEKEINEILKECCKSQDYVSFRRELIDKGYLSRTNDCREYWRNKSWEEKCQKDSLTSRSVT
jgi:hypothetical protein